MLNFHYTIWEQTKQVGIQIEVVKQNCNKIIFGASTNVYLKF